MSSTKASAKSCKVVTGRKPTTKQYRSLAGTVDTTTTYHDPHPMPPYGAPCWMQAYAEGVAWVALCEAANKYTQAAAAYEATWQAMETCLNGTPT